MAGTQLWISSKTAVFCPAWLASRTLRKVRPWSILARNAAQKSFLPPDAPFFQGWFPKNTQTSRPAPWPTTICPPALPLAATMASVFRIFSIPTDVCRCVFLYTFLVIAAIVVKVIWRKGEKVKANNRHTGEKIKANVGEIGGKSKAEACSGG